MALQLQLGPRTPDTPRGAPALAADIAGDGRRCGARGRRPVGHCRSQIPLLCDSPSTETVRVALTGVSLTGLKSVEPEPSLPPCGSGRRSDSRTPVIDGDEGRDDLTPAVEDTDSVTYVQGASDELSPDGRDPWQHLVTATSQLFFLTKYLPTSHLLYSLPDST